MRRPQAAAPSAARSRFCCAGAGCGAGRGGTRGRTRRTGLAPTRFRAAPSWQAVVEPSCGRFCRRKLLPAGRHRGLFRGRDRKPARAAQAAPGPRRLPQKPASGRGRVSPGSRVRSEPGCFSAGFPDGSGIRGGRAGPRSSLSAGFAAGSASAVATARGGDAASPSSAATALAQPNVSSSALPPRFAPGCPAERRTPDGSFPSWFCASSPQRFSSLAPPPEARGLSLFQEQ